MRHELLIHCETRGGILQGGVVPTVLRSGPYRFHFYSHEPNEPPHIHVDRDDATAKFWLTPLNLASSLGFEGHELTTLFRLVQQHEEELIDAWNSFFA